MGLSEKRDGNNLATFSYSPRINCTAFGSPVWMGLPRWLAGMSLPATQETLRDAGLIPGLGRSLEWEMATCSSVLAWEICEQRNLGGL